MTAGFMTLLPFTTAGLMMVALHNASAVLPASFTDTVLRHEVIAYSLTTGSFRRFKNVRSWSSVPIVQ